MDAAAIDTGRGKSTTLQITAQERGLFRMEFLCRASAEASELAQLSMSVFQDKQLAATVTLSGADKEWQKRVVDFPNPLFSYTFYAKLFFGISGMELKDVKIVMSESHEEKIRAREKANR